MLSADKTDLKRSARTDFKRQNMTSVDVRFWRLKSTPHWKSGHISNGRRPITFRYSDEAEKANEDIYDDLKLKKTSLVSMICTKIFQSFKGGIHLCI